MPLKDYFGWLRKRSRAPGPAAPQAFAELKVLPNAPAPDAAGMPRHFGDLWLILQGLAEEEDPDTFTRKTVTEHAAESLEGKKDVQRWIHAYRKRLDPAHTYRFPDHHPRHRGYCLMPRQFPGGTRWHGFHEDTLLRVRVPDQATQADLAAAIDGWLDGREASPR